MRKGRKGLRKVPAAGSSAPPSTTQATTTLATSSSRSSSLTVNPIVVAMEEVEGHEECTDRVLSFNQSINQSMTATGNSGPSASDYSTNGVTNYMQRALRLGARNQSTNQSFSIMATGISGPSASASDRTKNSASAFGEVSDSTKLQKTGSNQAINQSMKTHKMAGYLFCKVCKNDLAECDCKNKFYISRVAPADEVVPAGSGSNVKAQAHIKLNQNQNQNNAIGSIKSPSPSSTPLSAIGSIESPSPSPTMSSGPGCKVAKGAFYWVSIRYADDGIYGSNV